jgi:polyphenol oxidase
MANWVESAEAIGAVDALLAGAGLEHGRRSARGGSWKGGERVKVAKGLELGGAGRKRAPGVVRVEAWAKFPWLRAGFSTRQGGGSTAYSFGEFGEQNLGWTKEDEAGIVAENRRRFLGAVAGKRRVELVTVRQFHSGMMRVVERGGALETAEGKAVLRGDGLMTREAGVMLGVQTADCVPVLIADTRTRAVAAFHAGWRGTLARILERGVGTMRREFGSRPKDLVAAVGPAIGPCCFAVGEEVRFEFESQFEYAGELFSEVYDSDPVRDKYPLLFMTARAPGHSNIGPQIHLDLWEANRRQLLDAGVGAEAITVVGECSACVRLRGGRRKYFSHRAESGFTGRMMGAVGVVKE